MLSTERLLIIGGLILLSIIVLSFNTNSLEQTSNNLNNEAMITGISLGQSLLEEISSRAFDENTVNTNVSSPNDLTVPPNLGKESGEIISTQFDDIDDFDGFARNDSLPRLGVFNLRSEVYYVNANTPNTKSNVRTFNKRIDIKIANIYMADTLTLHKILSY